MQRRTELDGLCPVAILGVFYATKASLEGGPSHPCEEMHLFVLVPGYVTLRASASRLFTDI